MATHTAQRNFQRLKLDTSGWQVPPSKDDVEATGIPVPAAQVLGRTGYHDLQTHTVIPEETEDDVNGAKSGAENGRSDSREAAASVMYESRISLEDGQTQPSVQPMAIQGRTSRRRGTGRSMMQELAQCQHPTAETSSNETAVADDEANGHYREPVDGESPSQYRKGEPRWPLLQATTDELADEDKPDKEAALSPGSVAETSLDGTRTPGYFFFGEHSVSPSMASSPIQQFPPLHDSGVLASPRMRDGHQRRSHDRPSTIRRESRRSSAKSSLAKSPASSFLSQFGKTAAAAPEPDDDGQTIGDHGEYVIGRQIGYGGFSTIKEIYSLENQTQVMRAVKIVRKQVTGKNEEDNERLQNDFGNEVSIWRLLKHENLLPLVAVFTNTFATFCIMEMNTGGTLFDLVRSNRRRGSSTLSPRAIHQGDSPSHDCDKPKDRPGLPVDLVRHYLKQLSSAVRYLHQDMHIVHRDIKLENCLVSTQSTDLERDPSMKVTLCDFGMADFISADAREQPVFDEACNGHAEQSDETNSPHIIGPSELSTNVAGSLEYACPELIRASAPLFTPSVDIWAFGVVSHALFTADLPFRHSLQPKVQMMILQGLWDSRPLAKACAADSTGIELVAQCLETNVQRRWAIGDVTNCKFLA